jgi:ribosomal protein S1
VASKSDNEPVYYDPDWIDPLDKAKKKYFGSPKGKAALKRYNESDKGQATLERTQERQRVARACSKWLREHPGKTIVDFLKEQEVVTVVIKSIEEHGLVRWVRTKCPDCNTRVHVPAYLGQSNTNSVECTECHSKLTVSWDEKDETLT